MAACTSSSDTSEISKESDDVYGTWLDEYGYLFINDDNIKFNPPLYRQRYLMVKQIIREASKGTFSKVVDLGCSDMKFFPYLRNLCGVKEIMLIDLDEQVLEENVGRVNPLAADHLFLRDNPLHVYVICADATIPHNIMDNTHVVTMVEVIEHMPLNAVRNLAKCVFGYIKPKLVIITTPNSDFNKYIPNFKPGTFRHWDHKFEWTSLQFKQWCEGVVGEYSDYSVDISGCGLGPNDTYCTQVAVFTYNLDTSQLSNENSQTNSDNFLMSQASNQNSQTSNQILLMSEANNENSSISQANKENFSILQTSNENSQINNGNSQTSNENSQTSNENSQTGNKNFLMLQASNENSQTSNGNSRLPSCDDLKVTDSLETANKNSTTELSSQTEITSESTSEIPPNPLQPSEIPPNPLQHQKISENPPLKIIAEFSFPFDKRTREERDRDHSVCAFYNLSRVLQRTEFPSYGQKRTAIRPNVSGKILLDNTSDLQTERTKFYAVFVQSDEIKSGDEMKNNLGKFEIAKILGPQILEAEFSDQTETTENFETTTEIFKICINQTENSEVTEKIETYELNQKCKIETLNKDENIETLLGGLSASQIETTDNLETINQNGTTENFETASEHLFFIVDDVIGVLPFKSVYSWVNFGLNEKISETIIRQTMETECFEIEGIGETIKGKIRLVEEREAEEEEDWREEEEEEEEEEWEEWDEERDEEKEERKEREYEYWDEDNTDDKNINKWWGSDENITNW